MKRSRFTEEQIIGVLKEHQAGLSAAELCRSTGQGGEGWCATGSSTRPNAVTWAMTEKGYSQRRACRPVGIDPRVHRYQSSRPDDAGLRRRLRELSGERRRFGYRRLHILLEREGWEVNWKKLYCIYREERLTVHKRGGRKRALGTRAPMAIPQGPNQRWSLDFVTDSLSWGRRFRVLCIIDDFSRECLGAIVDTLVSGHCVARELDRIAELRGYPCMVVPDRAIVRHWSEDNGEGHRTDLERDPDVAAGPEGRMALHRARQTDAERLRRKLQRPPAGRMPERAPVHQSAPCPPLDRGMAQRLQPSPPAYEPRRPYPAGIPQTVRKGPNPEQN
jgi:transposase InsO family protein